MSINIPLAKKFKVLKKTDCRCAYCGDPLNLEGVISKCGVPVYDYGIDHVVPKSKGGSDDMDNLLPCCNICNSSKNTKSLEEYRVWATLKRNNIPTFSAIQIEYLKSKVAWENIFPPLIKFYFETIEGGEA